jgi:hypothetical protein
MKIKPFDAGNWFPINNAVFDEIMPTLSPSAWKVLCVVIRATWGWKLEDGTRKTEDYISYSQFLKRSGISSPHTIASAIQECLDMRYLIRRESSMRRVTGISATTYFYSLNVEYELEIAAKNAVAPAAKNAVAPAAKNAVAPAAKNAVAPAAKNAVTKRNKQTNDDGIVDLLLQHNIIESVAREIADSGCTPDLVNGWLTYIEEQTQLTNPTAFLVSRLRLGERPPVVVQNDVKENEAEKRHRRYAGGKYADLIQS